MPRRSEVKKVLVIGSGPIVIGQAAEFDYAGTQACRALRADGIEVVLVNSNPATIMTDANIADRVYIEPLTVDTLKKIISREMPDSILPTLGGQTGLNLAVELSESGFLEQQGVRLLGTAVEAIRMAEDRLAFKEAMERIGEPCIASKVVNHLQDALDFANEIGYPVIVRPAYTLGGSGGGIAVDPEELKEIGTYGLRISRVGQVLIEKSITGWKEIEYEVMRDSKGNSISVCNMENVDPVGIHTGDSIVVAPSQTLTDREHQMLRSSALKIIATLGIEGGCNVQFALHPKSFEYAVIEVNPRVSRSSALASKATGYPIAKVATKIAIGYGLDEILNEVTGKTFACFEPTLDYVVVKIPKWPFDKFVSADRTLGTQMKATGEVMAISNSFESALMKAIRSLELGLYTLEQSSYKRYETDSLLERIRKVDDERIFAIAEAFRRGVSMATIVELTQMDDFFLWKIQQLVNMEEALKCFSINNITKEVMDKGKKMGFPDVAIAGFLGCDEAQVKALRKKWGIVAVYKTVDTCAAEFDAATPYYYSTYDRHSEVISSKQKKVLVIGSGPIRIGQGIEFDYCTVHSVWALKDLGYETIIINNNPETVSTDFDTADRLYFEPLTPEDVANVVEAENPIGAIVQFGGQTAIKLTKALNDMGVKIFGTEPLFVDMAEDREKFDLMLEEMGILRPKGKSVYNSEQAISVAQQLGYPVLVRPSYVLGGQGMEIAYNDHDISDFMSIVNRVRQEHPILIDKYLMGKELEVDAICDGEHILIPGIMEHLERAGIHSGDSISVYPTQSIAQDIKDLMVETTGKLARALQVVGLMNVQYVLFENQLYVIEVNPRSSRTVPYISKVTGIPMVNMATQIMMGKKLADFPHGTGIAPEVEFSTIKVPVFSFEKLRNVDISLGPEMKSTGEVLGIGKTFPEAFLKGIIAAGIRLPKKGSGILMTVRDTDKEELVLLANEFQRMGFSIWATEKTARALETNGIKVSTVAKIGEGSPNLLDIIEEGRISMVINTPTRGKKPERDGFKIRRKAIEMAIPCLTALDTARGLASILALEMDEHLLDVVRLDQYSQL